MQSICAVMEISTWLCLLPTLKVIDIRVIVCTRSFVIRHHADAECSQRKLEKYLKFTILYLPRRN